MKLIPLMPFPSHLHRTRLLAAACLSLLLPGSLWGQANMRREGALTLTQTVDDTKGFYGATIDASNGFAYFGSKYVYKVNLATPLPTQVGAGVSIGRLPFSGAMDAPAGCAYFAVGSSLYQILANGTNAASLGSTMISPFGSSAYITQVLVDNTDPANHYLYAMTETSVTNSALYKIALNSFPSSSAVLGSASTTLGQPALGYGVIDLTNKCAYYGTFTPVAQPPQLVKFALGAGTNPPANLGSLNLETGTNRSVGGIALDPANGYGYCCSDGDDLLFGHARVYKWALNGTNSPTLTAFVDMHTNEGYCHVAAIRPAQGLLYFSSDLSYPAYVYRFRLPPGTNAPVETGNLALLGTTNTVVPAWGYNPTNQSNWGEVFTRSMVYDPVRDFIYIGRDYTDQQVQPYTDQVVKVALDRNEMLVALTPDGATTNNAIPYAESFASYTNGFDLVNTNGWQAQDAAMAVVGTNGYAYAGAYPIAGPPAQVLLVNGAVTNRFSAPAATNVAVDLMVQAQYWTDPLPPVLTNTPFAFIVTTNGHLAVWNETNPPAAGNGWTPLLDTSIASNQFTRVTVEAAYNRDVNGEYYYRVWVNGTASTNPQTWYASAATNQNQLGDVMAQGYFALGDLVVTPPAPGVTGAVRTNGNMNVACTGLPGLAHRVWGAASLAPPIAWVALATNAAGTNGVWTFTDTNTAGYPQKFYRASLP